MLSLSTQRQLIRVPVERGFVVMAVVNICKVFSRITVFFVLFFFCYHRQRFLQFLAGKHFDFTPPAHLNDISRNGGSSPHCHPHTVAKVLTITAGHCWVTGRWVGVPAFFFLLEGKHSTETDINHSLFGCRLPARRRNSRRWWKAGGKLFYSHLVLVCAAVVHEWSEK